MPLDWTPFAELVRSRERFLLMTHLRPDCDGLGSELGLADALRQKGRSERAAILGPLPARYDFVDPAGEIEEFSPRDPTFAQVDAVVILDTGTWNQLGEFGAFLRSLEVPKVVIDHHPTQDDLGALRLVDTGAEATGRLVYEAARALGVTPSPVGARSLFLALASDTGWFRHSNTTAATFELAGELVRLGADPTALYEALYERNTLARLRLTGVALERLQTFAAGRLAVTELYRRDFDETGAGPSDTEDLVNYPRSLAGVEVALLLAELPEGRVKASFRSRRNVDVRQIAERFGGGGHRAASGAVLSGTVPEVKQRLLQVLTPLLAQPA